ncbi:hypothetical protein EU524_01290 [Candidatus Thorarchaeota archaeon]|nr:MAG: hypothetical protein EU524_01290 [Candidatus Thorarchaeota archaeon]
MKDPFNILVAGVGGQGNLVCGRVLAEAAVLDQLRPVVGDTFGASRRGGGVTTHVRIGTRDWGPLIPAGEVDILLGLETMETYRAASALGGMKTAVVVADTRIPTPDVSAGKHEYAPFEAYIRELSEVCEHEAPLVYPVRTAQALENLSSPRVLNVYMIGVMAAIQDGPPSQQTIERTVKAIFDEDSENVEAVRLGFEHGKEIGPEGP